MKKIIKQGEIIPKGYGIAYYEMWVPRIICFPIPINIIIALARKVWIWCMWRYGLPTNEYTYFKRHYLDKKITQDHVDMFMKNTRSINELKDDLRSYFEIE